MYAYDTYHIIIHIVADRLIFCNTVSSSILPVSSSRYTHSLISEDEGNKDVLLLLSSAARGDSHATSCHTTQSTQIA